MSLVRWSAADRGDVVARALEGSVKSGLTACGMGSYYPRYYPRWEAGERNAAA